jgi:hypothetical protein
MMRPLRILAARGDGILRCKSGAGIRGHPESGSEACANRASAMRDCALGTTKVGTGQFETTLRWGYSYVSNDSSGKVIVTFGVIFSIDACCL